MTEASRDLTSFSQCTVRNSVELSQMFKDVFPEETKSSLAHMTSFLLHRRLSKFDQCSSWVTDKYRLSSIHYALLDSYLPLVLYKRLVNLQELNQVVTTTTSLTDDKQRTVVN